MVDTINEMKLYTDVSSLDSTNINVKFFTNPLFSSTLREYLWKEYTVNYWISSEVEIDDEIGVPIQFSGTGTDIEHARHYIKSLFKTMKSKVYNNENTDKKGK